MRIRIAIWAAMAAACWAQPGVITTVAGTGVRGFGGDGGQATAAQLNAPSGVAVDAAGNLYIADYGNSRIRKVAPDGTITTVAGCGTPSAVCINQATMRPATEVLIFGPWDVAVDLQGNVYFTNSGNNRVQQVLTSTGVLWDYAGVGPAGTSSTGFSGDGGQALPARLNNPVGVSFDAQNNLYIVDHNNQRIRRVTPAGSIISTFAGSAPITGTTVAPGAFTGDGGPAANARLNAPHGVAADRAGNVYIADTTNYRIRKVTPGGTISTIAGTGSPTLGSIAPLGDGGPAASATLVPWDVDADAAGNLYISDWLGDRIRRIDGATGIITTVAGTGTGGFSGDGGPGTGAQVSAPQGIAVDAQGNVYIADTLNHRVRKINAVASAPLPAPEIRTANPVVPSFLGKAGFSSNMYVEIYGSNFSRVTRTWAGGDFDGANAPASLEGVSVTVNGRPAFIYYVSPGQININVPEDTAVGPVTVQVRTASGASNTVTANRTRLSPTMLTTPAFLVGGKQYVVAQMPNQTFVGRPNMIAGVGFVAARPGETVSIYALGLGPTSPATQAGVTNAAHSAVTLPLKVEIGGVEANVSFKGALAGYIGLYQLNVVVPNVAAGDQRIELTVDGVRNEQELTIVVGP